MNCQDIKHYSLDYLEQKLPEQKQAAFLRHLESCESCRAYMQFVREAWTGIEEEKQLKANPFLATRVMQEVAPQETGKRPVKPALLWLQNAIVVLFIAAGIFVGVNTGIRMYEESPGQEQPTYATTYFINDLEQENVETLISEE